MQQKVVAGAEEQRRGQQQPEARTRLRPLWMLLSRPMVSPLHGSPLPEVTASRSHQPELRYKIIPNELHVMLLAGFCWQNAVALYPQGMSNFISLHLMCVRQFEILNTSSRTENRAL